jgi:hypothetical protein
MADFETAINDAIAVQEIPGCALVSTNRDGIVHVSSLL